MLSIFIDEKHHHLVTYPVCEVPKTDFCMIFIDQYRPVSFGYQLSGYISWLSVIYYRLAITCLSTGYQVAMGWGTMYMFAYLCSLSIFVWDTRQYQRFETINVHQSHIIAHYHGQN